MSFIFELSRQQKLEICTAQLGLLHNMELKKESQEFQQRKRLQAAVVTGCPDISIDEIPFYNDLLEKGVIARDEYYWIRPFRTGDVKNPFCIPKEFRNIFNFGIWKALKIITRIKKKK